VNAVIKGLLVFVIIAIVTITVIAFLTINGYIQYP